MEEIKFIIFYTCFILFITFITGVAGITFFSEDLGFGTETSFEFAYNPLIAYGVFTTLFFSGLVPELTFIFSIMFLPYFFALAYIIWKALPFT